MITKNYIARYSSENQREEAKQRFVKNDCAQLVGKENELGMQLYQIGSTEITFMNRLNAELGIEIRTPYALGMNNLVRLLQTDDYLGTKLEEEK